AERASPGSRTPCENSGQHHAKSQCKFEIAFPVGTHDQLLWVYACDAVWMGRGALFKSARTVRVIAAPTRRHDRRNGGAAWPAQQSQHPRLLRIRPPGVLVAACCWMKPA